ncbi:MAG: hypothetical protein NVS1B2_00780 [Vulcanimicrobiaceae bacterium]
MTTQLRDFRSVLDVLWRRRLELVALLLVALFVTWYSAKHVKPKYSAVSTLLLVAEPPDADKMHPTTVQKPLLTSDLPAIVTSETVLSRFREQTGSKLSSDTLRSKIRARVGGDSNLLPIEFSDASDATAISSANALSAQTSRYYREIATSRFDSLVADFSAQLKERAARLRVLDQQLQELAGEYPYVDSKDGTSSVYDRLVHLRAERAEVAATADGDQAQATETTKRIAQARPLALSDVTNQDQAYRRLSEQYGHDLAAFRHTAAYGAQNYPGLGELQGTVEAESRDVARARNRAAAAGPQANASYVAALADVNKARATAAADRAKLASIDAEIANLDGSLSKGGAAARVAQVRRDRDAAGSAYELLAGRLDKALADRSEAASTGSLVPIDRAAVASRQVWTTSALMVVALGVFSIWLAFSLIFLIEALDVRFRTPSSVERVFGAPVIGNLT